MKGKVDLGISSWTSDSPVGLFYFIFILFFVIDMPSLRLAKITVLKLWGQSTIS